MKLKDATLSYPAIRYKVDVTHFTSRYSTAMEWLVLEVTRKAMTNHDLEGVPIANVFEHVFQINDSDLMIKPCILSLRDGGALIAEDIYDETSLRDVPLRNLRLTEDGARMQQDGRLPGALSTDSVYVTFDPIHQELLTGKTREDYTEYASGIHVREIEDPFDEAFPSALVMEYLTEAKKKKQIRWMTPTTNIHEAVPDDAALLWKNVSRRLTVGEGWECSVDGDEDGFLSDAVLNEITADSPEQYADAPALDALNPDNDVKQLIELVSLKGYLDSQVKRDTLFVIEQQQFSEALWSAEGKKQKSLRVCIVENAEKEGVVLTGNHLSVYLPDNLLDDGMLYLSEASAVCVGRAHLKSPNAEKDTILAYVPADDFKSRLTSMVHQVVEKYAASYHSLLYLLLEIDEKERFYQAVRDAARQTNSLAERQTFLDTVNREGMQIYNRKLLPPDLYGELLLNADEIKKRLTCTADVEQLVSEYAAMKVIRESDELLRSVVRIALEACPEVKNANELWHLWGQLRSVKKSLLAWINSTKLYTRFYTREVVLQIAKVFAITGESAIEGYTPIEDAFLGLERTAHRVLEKMPELDVNTDCSSEHVLECVLLHREELSALHSEVRNWDDAVQSFEMRVCELNDVEADNPTIHAAVGLMDRLRDALSIFFDESAVKFPRVFVVDTCALMHTPELISTFSDGKALLIVPILVQNELDGLKESDDEETAFQARDAIRQIEAYRSFDWLDNTQNSCPELLSRDMNPESNDNKILSIGIKYIYKSAVLISDDANLRNLASSQNVKSMDSEGYMKAKSHEQSEEARGKKKGKKKKG